MGGQRGRPIKLTPDIQQKIVEAIKMGNYIETAAAFAGISKNTLYEWLKRGAREKERIAGTNRKPKASEAPFVRFSDVVEKAMADAEVRDVLIIANAAKENWQAAAWRLERKYPDRWGRADRFRQDQNNNAALNALAAAIKESAEILAKGGQS